MVCGASGGIQKSAWEWARVTVEELEGMTGEQVKGRIGVRIEEEWREEMERKSTL